MLERGEAGQICLRAPSVMARYWRNPEDTAKALDAGGWLRTGDLGLIDDRGCLRITGRISDMYIRGGYNVFPWKSSPSCSPIPASPPSRSPRGRAT